MNNALIKFIMVQSPEPCRPGSVALHNGFATIAEIGKERIRRAGEKIKRENPQIGEGLDIGFRVLKLDSSNAEDGHVKPDRSEEDLLFWAMFQLGVSPTCAIHRRVVDGQTVFDVGNVALSACFGQNITRKVINSMVRTKPASACFLSAGLTDEASKHMRSAFAKRSPDTVIKVIE